MSLEAFWNWLADTELAFQIGATWWFPLLETLHVLSVTLLVGAILMVDVRLLGWAGKKYALAVFVKELTPWSWGALIPAVITGLGLFISRPGAYAANPAFQAKLVLLIFAGINVYVFHRFTYTADPIRYAWAIRLAGLSSLLIWFCAILAGRWVGHIN